MVKTIYLKNNSKKEYFLIHGYTGSPEDFNELPQYLHSNFNADVKIMLLPGHGTRIEDLDDLHFADFIQQIKNELEKDIHIYNEVILGGISFGALVALVLAKDYPVQGVLSVSPVLKLKLPFSLLSTKMLQRYKKYWKKQLPGHEKELRKNAFYYQHMHVNGLDIIKEANRELKKNISKIQCRVLTIYSNNDPLGKMSAVKNFEKKLLCPHEHMQIDDKNHNIFFINGRNALYEKIGEYFKKTAGSKSMGNQRVAAIVPAYNEGKNIATVLKILTQTPIVSEVIVIDDGSSDNTSSVVKQFPRVKLLTNIKNQGKAQSLQRGIDSTDADILFFCDADLQGLTPDIIQQIIQPVIDGKYSMFIGVRNNVMQKTITLFGINSGERALHRKLWEDMPDGFKFRYRVEAGLNFMAQSQGSGYGWKKFDYYHSIKEKKYGFIKGTVLRWWMNFDVGYAYMLAMFRATIRKKI